VRDDRVECPELDLVVRRDDQRLGRPVRSGAAELDVAAPPGVDDELEAVEDQLRAAGARA
jgi:hypothetical protein